MNNIIYINALRTERNNGLKMVLIDFLRYAELEKRGGKTIFNYRLDEDEKGKAYALANFDNFENCQALITHDLCQFICNDLGSLIDKLRTE